MVLSQGVRESLTELSHLSQPPKEGREQARQVSGARGPANAKHRDGNVPALFREELEHASAVEMRGEGGMIGGG